LNRQQEIIKAAAKIFFEKGYHAATIRDVANEVGLLKGSLYYYIEGKEQVLLDVVLSAVEVLCDGLHRVMEEKDLDPRERLRKAILSHMHCYEARYEEVTVFLNEISNLPPSLKKRLREAVEGYEGMWISILKEGVSAGRFRSDLDLKLTLRAIFGMCNWTHKWYKQQGRLKPGDIGEFYADIILRGIESS